MADKKISQLTAATTPLAGTEVVPVVQSGVTKKVPVSDLTAGRAISATEATLTTGNLVIGTSGKGIDFSATAGTGTSKLLADYEEGTWTPSVGGTATYTARTGTYTKIGNVVVLYCDITINSIGSGSTGSITGIPYSGGVGSISAMYWSSLATGCTYINGTFDGASTIVFTTTNSAQTTAGYSTAILTSGSRIQFTAIQRI